MNLTQDSNIVLTGMPGVGKSTVGVLLAKATGRNFMDTDVLMQAGEGRPLQEIIDADGADAFCRVEERYILCLDCRRHVIATGGSVVYSAPAMAHLKSAGVCVYLRLAMPALLRRIEDLHTRGIVMARGQSLESLYEQRRALYEQYADLTVDCDGMTQDRVVAEIMRALG